MGITHWDDVEKIHRDRGQMSATLTPLGTAAGSWRAGATRIELEPGEHCAGLVHTNEASWGKRTALRRDRAFSDSVEGPTR